MSFTDTRQFGYQVRLLIIAAAIGITALFGASQPASAAGSVQIRPASAAENELVKSGHRYYLYQDSARAAVASYSDNHRIGQE